LPPFILYKGKNMYRRWMVGGPAGARYGISESGWMDPANFLSRFLKLFLPAVSHLTKTGPVLLFDGHYSHISLELIRAARQNNVLLCLPPNTTHILQPLYVGVFSPLKTSWRKILKLYRLQTKGQKAKRKLFQVSSLNYGRASSLSTARVGLEEQGCFLCRDNTFWLNCLLHLHWWKQSNPAMNLNIAGHKQSMLLVIAVAMKCQQLPLSRLILHLTSPVCCNSRRSDPKRARETI